jgi:hypothetical protein
MLDLNITLAKRTSLNEYKEKCWKQKKTYTITSDGEPTFEGGVTEEPR